MFRLTGIGNVWNVVREINVGEIKEEAEQPIRIAVIGPSAQRQTLIDALYAAEQRFAGDYHAVAEYELPLTREQNTALQRCDLALLVVDEQASTDADVATAADQIDTLGVPAVALVVGSSMARRTSLRHTPSITVVQVADLEPATLAQRFVPEVIERLPEDQRIAAARAVPLLRDAMAKRLINETSMSNATYALTTGIPEMVPILNLPLNAADMLVLTKNQVLLTYKLALAFGAPPDFQSQMREVIPVIGGGFIWRQLARQLVGLIPVLGIVPKVAVAYAGTYATGQIAQRWYSTGEVLKGSALRSLYDQALTKGRQRAQELIARRKQNGEELSDQDKRPSLVRRLLRRK